jgi:membrane protease YdiL (CAAX protease family)
MGTSRGLGELKPALSEVALAFAGLLAGYLVAMLVVGGLQAAGVHPGPLGLLAGPLITAVAVVVYRKLGEQSSRYHPHVRPVLGPLAPVPWSSAAVTTALAIVVALVGSMGLGIVLDLLGVPVAEQGHVVEIAEAARAGERLGEAAMLTLSALVAAPIVEELLFRHLLFRRIRRQSGRAFAYALSAFGFAVIHANPAGLVIYAWLGLCFAYTLERTGRISAAILVHVGNNAYVLAALFVG